jgi:hypothetical protein
MEWRIKGLSGNWFKHIAINRCVSQKETKVATMPVKTQTVSLMRVDHKHKYAFVAIHMEIILSPDIIEAGFQEVLRSNTL